MPRTKKRKPARKPEGLTPLVRLKLLDGIWWDGIIDGQLIPDDDLEAYWQEYRDEILKEHTPDRIRPDQPCWGEYVFEMVPEHGPRLGVPSDDENHGYCRDGRDCEPWKAYILRCGIRR